MSRHLLVIGAQRSGTTYLAALLDSHPEITMARPARPEPKVFLSEEAVRRGLTWYERTYFDHARTEVLLGEKSTSYLEQPESARRAAAVLGPTTPILVQLRDPVSRAVSNWRFSTRHGLEDRPLETALRDSLEGPRDWDRGATSVSPYAYLERGRYAEQLEPWAAAFPESLQVLFLEEVACRPGAVFELYEWLGVDSSVRPSQVDEVVNASDGIMPGVSADLEALLREYFADSDAELSRVLGRPLPWSLS
jgi:hypothetical protein